MHLFSNIKYQLSGQEIESLMYPGQATTMLGLLKYADDIQRLNQCWVQDTAGDAAADYDNNMGFKIRQKYVMKTPTPKGSFSFCVPLKHIFGFAEDYQKVVYGFKHTLTLVKKSKDNADDDVSHTAATDKGTVRLDKLSWFIPHVTPSLENKLQLSKVIEAKSTLDIGYRNRQCDSYAVPQTTSFSWRLGVKASPEKPRWIIIGLQTLRDGNEMMNSSLFDNCKVKNVSAWLNSRKYPAIDYNVSFEKSQFSRLYNEVENFRSNYYNIDELLCKTNLNPQYFKDLFPIFVIDVSKQSEKLKD